MAQITSDREDLFEEAKGLAPRADFTLDGTECLVGFSRDNSVSFYFGQDFMLRFSSKSELRRAYDSGTLLRAGKNRKLEALTRARTTTESLLIQQDWTPEQIEDFKDRAQRQLKRFLTELQTNSLRFTRVAGTEPQTLLERLKSLVESLANQPIVIADGMGAPKRRT